MARNGLKIANSLDCAFHFESDFNIRTEFSEKTSLKTMVCKNGVKNIQAAAYNDARTLLTTGVA